jgi:predicted ATPase
VAGRLADGVWLVELAPVRDPALVPSVVAVAVGVREQPGEPAAGTLARQQLLAVARLVTRLDGMPLAIELAAARVEALGVAGLLDRIDDRFTLLAGGDRTAASGQRSLAATVEWSYQLLGEAGRRVFRAVSVFPGRADLTRLALAAGLV